MQGHNNSSHSSKPDLGFWRSPTGITLIVFLAIAAILLGYEHRVHIFGGSSGTFLFLIAWIGLHYFMHRGHGGHGGHAQHDRPNDPKVDTSDDASQAGREKS